MRYIVFLAAFVVASFVPLAVAQTVELDLDNGSVAINYQVTGVDVHNVKQESDSIVFSVSAHDELGSFVVILDRNVIDAMEDGSDVEYIVLVDEFPNFEFIESGTTDTSRTLRIPVSQGSTEIEIVGTVVGSAMTDDKMTGGAMTNDNMTNDAMTGDTMTDDNMTNDTMTDNNITNDAMTGDTMTDDNMTNDTMTNDAMTGDTMTDDNMTNDAINDNTMSDDKMDSDMHSLSVSCGYGTELGSDNQTCVLISKSVVPLKELVFGIVAGFMVSLIVIIVLYPISRLKSS